MTATNDILSFMPAKSKYVRKIPFIMDMTVLAAAMAKPRTTACCWVYMVPNVEK